MLFSHCIKLDGVLEPVYQIVSFTLPFQSFGCGNGIPNSVSPPTPLPPAATATAALAKQEADDLRDSTYPDGRLQPPSRERQDSFASGSYDEPRWEGRVRVGYE
jgi:hypothetical protein